MKQRVSFRCSECGFESPKWFGKCPQCGQWNTAVQKSTTGNRVEGTTPSIVALSELSQRLEPNRFTTGFSELDTALGGGFVPGQIVLLGGEPGVGKSTLALQICSAVSQKGLNCFYATAEESLDQVALRAKRVRCANQKTLMIASSSDVESILDELHSCHLVVFDSIQTMRSLETDGYPGGVLQVRMVAEKIIERCKVLGTTAILIAHVTKGGDIAGPKLVEHIVDTVLYFEGERNTDIKILRTMKNRFGPSGEIAIFEMTENGLKELRGFVKTDPTSQHIGNCVTCIIEGSRAFIVQLQALVSRSKVNARRVSNGFDITRLLMVVAVLSKHLKIPLEFHDVYVNVLGGLKITDTAADAAVAGAILSSFLEKPVDVAMLGEIGLDGRVKGMSRLRTRVEALRKAGYLKAAMPVSEGVNGIDVVQFKSITDITKILGVSHRDARGTVGKS